MEALSTNHRHHISRGLISLLHRMQMMKELLTAEFLRELYQVEAEILNPAFDCTPRDFVTGYITEKGILAPPFTKEMFE